MNACSENENNYRHMETQFCKVLIGIAMFQYLWEILKDKFESLYKMISLLLRNASEIVTL